MTFIARTPPLFLNIGRACSADRATVRKSRSDELTAARAVPQRVNVDSDTVARLETVRLPTALDLPILFAWPLVWAVWAVLTRGGWLLRPLAIIVARFDSRPAERWRCGLRAVLAWAPATTG